MSYELADDQVEVKVLVMCDLAQVTQEGRVSLLGIFEHLETEELPIKIPRFFMVGMISGKPLSRHQISFRLTSPLKKPVIKEQIVTAMLGYDGSANIFNDSSGIIFYEYGVYELTMVVDGEVKKTTRLMIEDKPQKQSSLKKDQSLAN